MLKVIDKIHRIEFFTECFSQKIARIFKATVFPDMLSVPLVDGLKIAFSKTFFYINTLAHLMKKMSAVSRAKRVGRKISDASARPMTVLKDALAIVRHGNTEVFLIKLVPLISKVLYLKLSDHHSLFKLIANHYVQAIRNLVCLGADK